MCINQDSKDMTTNSSVIFKNSQDDAEVYSAAPAQIKRYYNLMDDEGPDDVFIQPPFPPPCRAVLSPTEGSTSATPADSGVTIPTEAADATKANPCSLDRHHGEKQLMAAQNELDEEITSTMQPSMKPMDDTLFSNDMNSTPMDYQDQISADDSACLLEQRQDKTGKAERTNTSGDEESNEEPEDGTKPWKEEENYKQIYSDVDENPGDTSNQEKECDKNYKGISCLDERDLELSRTMSDLNKINDFTSSEPSEFTNDEMEERTKSSSKEEYVGTRSPDNILTRSEQESDETIEQVDGNWRLTSDIQQGEQLLQRLQMVQLRHDDIPNGTQEIIEVAKAEEEDKFRSEVDNGGVRGKSATSDEYEEEGALKEKELRANVTENENNEDNGTNEARTSLSTPPGTAQHKQIDTKDADESLDDYSEIFPSSTLPPHSPREMPCEIPLISAGHRFSAAETSMEKQIQEAARARQNLQRAGGVFNLADNPDVLEIPFKTNVSLESLLTKACTVQQSQWQFSEKKMQKEISQEIQRELVLVNQGKIPGEYCKGEARQLKETKLLFEAFQQGNMEGPTRHRKLPTTAMKGPVYPSVLERTRSLEMFSLKPCLVSRAHSLRLCNSTTLEGDKSPETLRSKSPTGDSRDKTRSFPYSKHDKHLRLHRSMDSINSESSASAAESRGKTNERQGSPILRQNPFFKLRPAMALQPEVEKDIREAKEREEELRKQRCTLYGEDRHKSEEEKKHRCTMTLKSDVKLQSRGKLERLWPPPSKTDQKKSEAVQQEAKVHRAGGQKAPLWRLWESGLINGQLSEEKK